MLTAHQISKARGRKKSASKIGRRRSASVSNRSNPVRGRQCDLARFPRLSCAEPLLSQLLLSKEELAAIKNVSKRTIDNWVARKLIPRVRLSNRLTRFSLPKVNAALARYEVKEVGARQ